MMSSPTYPIACPRCGKTLDCVAMDSSTAPYLCHGDGRGFFACELTDDARSVYNADMNSWVDGEIGDAVTVGVQQELSDALVRGTCLREDQLGLVPLTSLQYVATLPDIDPDFLALVETQITNSGG